ncbi:MAG: acetolactate synthase small subunit [Candidatus Firestonebacteria bacterium]
MKREHTISGLVSNQSGVLCKIAGVFAKKKVNIKSLSAGETENSGVSRIIIVVYDEEGKIRLAEKEVKKLKEVIILDDLTRKEFINRELVLIKVKFSKDNISQIMQISEIFRSNVVGVGNTTITIEMSGDAEKIDGFVKLLIPFGIKSIARTGKIALKRGDEI